MAVAAKPAAHIAELAGFGVAPGCPADRAEGD